MEQSLSFRRIRRRIHTAAALTIALAATRGASIVPAAIVSPRAVVIGQSLVERRVTAAIATIAKGRRDCAAAGAGATGLGGHAGNAPTKGKLLLYC